MGIKFLSEETVWAIITIGAKKRKASECIIWGKRRRVSNRVCIFGETLNVWCSMASAAVVGATGVGATMVGAATVGAADVGVTSGVLYGAVVVVVMGGVLYGAAVVQQWLTLAQQCVRSNSWSNSSECYLCVRWCVEPCVAQCRYAGRRVVLSRDTQLDGCIRNRAKRCETLTEHDDFFAVTNKE